ncbi:MAG: hypothetical protein ABI200_07105 [Gaiellales bacterium]
MDVTRTPFMQRSSQAAHADVVARAASASLSEALPAEVSGTTDGPDLLLPTGVRLRRMHVDGQRVTSSQLRQAIRGVQMLPIQDQQLIARLGIVIELLPVRHLEQISGTSDPVVGATTVMGPPGNGRATRIRIAMQMGQLQHKTKISDVVKHEIGHVMAVTAHQDRSEQAAEAYAARY